MSVFVDTSVWSLALGRDGPSSSAQVAALIGMLESGEPILTTGFVLQELLQGFTGLKAREQIIERFSALPPPGAEGRTISTPPNYVTSVVVMAYRPERCTFSAQLCIHHNLLMLTSDNDFQHIAKHCALRIWPSSR